MNTEISRYQLEFVPADNAGLARYMAEDKLLPILREATDTAAEMTTHRWLLESPAKRYIYSALYGDLLQPSDCRLLDIAGGLSVFTRRLAECNIYHLIESLAHDSTAAGGYLKSMNGRFTFSGGDWSGIDVGAKYDVVVANDFLPNVDQRLEPFLRKFLPLADEIRLSLTYYDEPRAYRTRRIDGDEILTMLAWDGEQTFRALRKVLGQSMESYRPLFFSDRESIFKNGRQVIIGRIRRQDGGEP